MTCLGAMFSHSRLLPGQSYTEYPMNKIAPRRKDDISHDMSELRVAFWSLAADGMTLVIVPYDEGVVNFPLPELPLPSFTTRHIPAYSVASPLHSGAFGPRPTATACLVQRASKRPPLMLPGRACVGNAS